MGIPFEGRGARFRASFEYLRQVTEGGAGKENIYGSPRAGVELLPRPTGGRLPLLVTGSSRQDPAWSAQHADGWMTYPRDSGAQARVIAGWRDRVAAVGQPAKPVMQALYLDLVKDAEASPRGIHLGLSVGSRHLRAYLRALEDMGVNHVALNLRFNESNVETALQRLADDVIPDFPGKG